MKYWIEIYDTEGRRVAKFDRVPLLEVTRTTPDKADIIEGSLPTTLTDLSHGYRIRVLAEGELICEAGVTRVSAKWSDMRELVVDRYVYFHEVVECEAERPAREGNTSVARIFTGETISSVVKRVINSALGRVHYLVEHAAYPDGAQRECAKFLARKTAENELEVGGIGSGNWVESGRMDLSGAYAKDGDMIAGVVVDGAPWPDVRLMLVDCEETTRNGHAISRHPEVAEWTDGQYQLSGYKLKADAAKAALQNLIDAKGIDFLELNSHRGSSGAFDDRVDAYGRYIGLVYGGGECFSAALVEQGLGDVYLYEDGRYLVPEMELKDFFSYSGTAEASVEPTDAALEGFDASGGAFEVLTALAYAAGGYVWSVDEHFAVRFWRPERPDHVVYRNPLEVGVALGSDSLAIANRIYFAGCLYVAETESFEQVAQTYSRSASVAEYGARGKSLTYWGLALEGDVDRLCEGLLGDL
ncbi:MAG: hypothetical protein GY851_02525, partial [bacterium]|nr:hypothetical protein [bacterium]